MFETDSTVVSRAGDVNINAHTARNIIFRTEGRLTLWDLEKDELQTIVEADVIKYSLSQDGLKLVFAQSAGNGQPVFHLIFIDLETGTQRMLQENMRCLHNFEIAPDGSKLFFIAAEWDPQAELCEPAKRRNGQHFAETFSVNYPFYYNLGGTVFVQELSAEFALTTFGDCLDNQFSFDSLSRRALCINAMWSPDSKTLVWFDAKGIWTTRFRSTDPTLIYPMFANGEGYHLTNPQWSPSGSYLALHGHGIGVDNRRLIVHPESGNLIEAPYPDYGFFGLGRHPEMAWLNDDSLLFAPSGEIFEKWAMDDTGELVQIASVTLAHDDSTRLIDDLSQAPDGTIYFAWFFPGEGIFGLRSFADEPELLTSLIPLANYGSGASISWSPDYQNAVIGFWQNLGVESETRFFLYYRGDANPTEVTDILGSEARQIQWLGQARLKYYR